MNISMSFASLCKGCKEILMCYIYSIYFSLPHTVCSHPVEEKIKDGFNQQEKHQSLTLRYAAARIREAVAGAENSADLVLERNCSYEAVPQRNEGAQAAQRTIWISHNNMQFWIFTSWLDIPLSLCCAKHRLEELKVTLCTCIINKILPVEKLRDF